MIIRDAEDRDLAAIVEIYNSSIPGRLATSDLEPVTVDERQEWFDKRSEKRPIWVIENDDGDIAGWCSICSFYGRPAYHRTVEIGVYCNPAFQRQGNARALLQHAITTCPSLGIRTILAFVFSHNGPSLRLFSSLKFERWAHLPEVAELDNAERDVLILGLKV